MLLCTGCSGPAPDLNNTDIEIDNTVKQSTLLQEEPVNVGVLSIDSAVSVSEQYSPLMNYLSSEINRPVSLIVLSQESQFQKVEAGTLDFIINNPLAAVQIQRLYQTEFLVTHTRPRTGSNFSGLIVVDSDSTINNIEDLKGKRAACVNFQTAAAGCTFQIYHLLQNGFDPHKDFSQFIENKSQDNIVLAVLNGTIDVGFVRTGHLEKMLHKGLLSRLDEVRIIDAVDDDFSYSHSTEVYPEWPVAALPNTDPELVQQVKSALIKLTPEHPALARLEVDGFVPAVDYGQLHKLIESLRLKSWNISNDSL
ncbi:MAG: phosphate/phosphite/phosphonate ABC transporter substrate-binding protein [Cyanobacteria bacterium P01_H01_bin.21]